MDTETINRAKALYFKHMKLDGDKFHYMWEQCSVDYKAAWILIASQD